MAKVSAQESARALTKGNDLFKNTTRAPNIRFVKETPPNLKMKP